MTNDGLLDRNYLKGRDRDRINAILSGAGHNFRLLLKWLRLLFSLIRGMVRAMIDGRLAVGAPAQTFFTDNTVDFGIPKRKKAVGYPRLSCKFDYLETMGNLC